MTQDQILNIEKLTKHYKGVEEPSLKSIDLTINKGEVFGLLGPNGAGKTTLISIICGIIDWSSAAGHSSLSDVDGS